MLQINDHNSNPVQTRRTDRQRNRYRYDSEESDNRGAGTTAVVCKATAKACVYKLAEPLCTSNLTACERNAYHTLAVQNAHKVFKVCRLRLFAAPQGVPIIITSLTQRALLFCFVYSVFCIDRPLITQAFCSAHGMLRPQFVLFGDSLTQKACDPDGGWAAGLAHKYQRKARPTPLL